ncbi:SoxR reducing system RseC family protein [Candidatus Margulisiibacteriota bacterium]
MKETGKIIKMVVDIAEVEIEPSAACVRCKGCQVVSSGKMLLLAKNEIGAKVGDKIQVEIPESESIKASFLIFIFPLIALIVGYFIGVRLFVLEVFGIMFAIMFLGLSFLCLRLYDQLLKSRQDCRATIIAIE